MGWAKYYEDNVSICIGRMVVKETISVKHTPVVKYRAAKHMGEATSEHPIVGRTEAMAETFREGFPRTVRKGLELSFTTSPEVGICRKLQMNGWWWSTAKKCWCNFNTKVNRRYAEETAKRYQAQVKIVAAA